MSASDSDEEGYILVIEDDLSIQELFQLILGEEGWKTVAATDGPTGLKQAREQEPSLVILDMNLPSLHGEIIADGLHRLYDGIPILVVTANGHAQDNARAARAYGYLQKPFDLGELVAAVHQGLEHGRSIEHRRFPHLA